MTPPGHEHPEPTRDLPGIAAFAGLGLSIAITVGIFVGLGIWADSAFGTSPLCLIIGLVVGCTAAVASTIVIMRRYL